MRLNFKQASLRSQGFTLVEIMVAVSIFSIVALVAVSAILNANRLSQKAQATKLVMDNLNFALDSLLFKVRRSGQLLYCSSDHTAFPPVGATLNCGSDSVLVLSSPDSSIQEMYYFDSASHALKYWRSGDQAVRLTSAAVSVDTALSGFKVYNAEPAPDGATPGWPRLTVVVAGNAVVGHEQTSFKLQTTATTRQ